MYYGIAGITVLLVALLLTKQGRRILESLFVVIWLE